MAETRKYQTKLNLHCLLLFNFPHLSQRQIAFLGLLEGRNLFGPKDKISSHEKLAFRTGVQFLFLFVLTDAILLKLDLQKRTSVLGNPPIEKLFVYKNGHHTQKLETYYDFHILKPPYDSVSRLGLVADLVIQAIGKPDFEDGLRMGTTVEFVF